MNIIGRDWLVLTEGERLSVLSYAAYLTRKRWQKRMNPQLAG